MIDKETYEREITRMFDSVRTNSRGEHTCSGVKCEYCPFYSVGVCNSYGAANAYDVYEKAIKCIDYVERWSKDHPPKKHIKLTRLEYDILKWLDKGGYKFIVRSPSDNLMAHDSIPKKALNGWISENRYKTLTSFNDLLHFIKYEDEEPTSIKQVLKNCEVADDDD